MNPLEKHALSASKIDIAQGDDDQLCAWNEINFLKLLYFLWQDCTRTPHLAQFTIYMLNQPAQSFLALHKKPHLRQAYGLPITPSTHLGTAVYLALTDYPIGGTPISGLYQQPHLACSPVSNEPSVFSIDSAEHLIHRSLNLEAGAPYEQLLRKDGANNHLLKTILQETHASSLPKAYQILSGALQSRLLGVPN